MNGGVRTVVEVYIYLTEGQGVKTVLLSLVFFIAFWLLYPALSPHYTY
jgi:hypothetical protein